MSTNPVIQAEDLIQRGDTAQALQILRAATERGDAEAAYQHAIHLLVGQVVSRDLPAARQLLQRSVALGHAQAGMMEVALTASGAGSDPDWAAAVHLLEAAAKTALPAREALLLLRSMAVAEDGRPTARFAVERLSETPSVSIIREFLTPDECRHIAEAAMPILEPSTVVDPRSGRLIAHPVRTSHGAPIGPARETLPIQAILRRIAAVTSTDVFQGEPLTVLHYSPGQEYKPHFDAAPQFANQRISTVLLYLNEGFLGGETEFLHNGLKVAGRVGDAVIFENVTKDGRPDPLTQHAGRPVTQGVKWLATRWIRARKFDPWAPQ